MMTYIPVKHQGVTCSIPTSSTPNHHAQRIYATSVILLNLHKTMILPPVGKYIYVFQIDGKSAQAAKGVKSRIMAMAIDWCSFY